MSACLPSERLSLARTLSLLTIHPLAFLGIALSLSHSPLLIPLSLFLGIFSKLRPHPRIALAFSFNPLHERASRRSAAAGVPRPPPPRARRRSDDLPPPPHVNDEVGAPLGTKGWADEPGFRWWKDKEAEILSDIEPIIALTKDILHSDEADSSNSALWDLAMDRSMGARGSVVLLGLVITGGFWLWIRKSS